MITWFAHVRVRYAWLVLLGALVVVGCGDAYHFVPDAPPDSGVDGGDGGPPEPPPSTPTACATDEDCSALTNTTLCDTKAGYCVECDPARESELARCSTGTFCSVEGHCQLGCQTDADCPGITCDTDRGLCVNCQSDSNCLAGTTCIDAVCTPSCETSETCPNDWLCCDGACKNPETDPTSCGVCGKACDEGGACWNGVCGEGPCEPGTAECDGDATNGCETATLSDPENCGKCDLACASNFCAGGRCTTMECVPGTADCNGDEGDHCETDLTSVDSCTMCGQKCSSVHGTPACGKSGCSIECDDGYDDCDGKVSTGCEIDLQTDVKHCGACDTACTNEFGTTKCNKGECEPRCADGYADCDGDPTNGCETDTNSSRDSCGACHVKCSPDNATGSCKDGVCEAKCATGYADCDGNKTNGCEANLSSPETCGSCDNACSQNGGKAKCNPQDGSCTIKCDAGRADCVNGVADGCETDTTASANNCGGCGHACTSSVGTPACSDSTCGVSTCTAPLETCPGGGKCETNLSNDANNCGDCGHTCAFPSASGKCVNRVCELDKCDDGHKDCNGIASDGCESALGTTDNCRSCGEACKNDHGTNACTVSGCAPSCAAGWGDCDGNKNNGCETPLNTLNNCGACGAGCTKAHGTADCSSGSCQIATCSPGWDNCNSESSAKDGCETQLNSSTNCGGCGVACNLAHATSSCGSGSCQLVSCNSGYGDCSSSQAGCETPLFDVNNCNSCGDKCGSVNASPQCVVSGSTHVCQMNCTTHFGDCDGDQKNGCETQLNSKTNCGVCGAHCDDLANSTGSCSSYSCVQSCGAGYLDCTSADGCETPKGTVDNCTKCGEACTNAHGTAGCSVGGCTFSCTDAAWGNCDSKPDNGCETSLRTNANCNACGTVCDIPNSGESCSTGTCTATTCAAGYDDCDQNGSCETQLNTVSNCNACGHVCVAQNGTTACSGSAPPYACKPTCSTGYGDCNSNPDDGCETAFNTNAACTGCGDVCARAHATTSCSTGSCQIVTCSAGFRNCNTESSTKDGCETPITSSPNCGACGVTCQAVNGTNPCVGSGDNYGCVPSCNAGFANCNANANDGCETPLKTLTDCTACGDACARPHASASCSTGSCVTGGCVGNYLNCNDETTARDGCEVAIDNANCGSCGKACAATNTSSNNCSVNGASSLCQPVCLTGFGDCDGKPETGCETDTKTSSNCGGCGNVCTFANAAALCTSGSCALGTCNSGYANCNAVPGDGCEVQLGVNGNCSTCGETCTNSHGSNSCDPSAKICKPSCNTNFGDCDGHPENGCETDFTTATNCGGCGITCGAATPYCVVTGTTPRCQAQITLQGSTSGQAQASSLNVSYTPVSGTNRLILIGIAAESPGTGVGSAGSRPDSVTFGGTTLTQPNVANPVTEFQGVPDYWAPDNFIYLVPEAVIAGKSGAQTIAITTATTAPSDAMIIANVVQLGGVNQTTPLGAVAGGFLGTATTPEAVDPSVISPSLALTTTGSRIYSLNSVFWMDASVNCPVNTPTSGCPSWSVSPSSGLTLTETMSTTALSYNGASMRAFAMYVSAASASLPTTGSYSPSWSVPYSGRMTHFAVVVNPAQQ